MNMLTGIGDMHKKKVFHGKLDDPDSFVLVGSSMRIVNPSVDGRKFSDVDIITHRKNDLKSFKKFLINYASPTYESGDWVQFQLLFDYANVPQIKKHPYLKDEAERLDHLGALLDSCREQWDIAVIDWSGPQGFINHVRKWPQLSIFKQADWSILIPHNSCYRTLYETPPPFVKPYNPFAIFDLFRYIRNVLKHLKDEYPHKTVSQTERDIQQLFPGFVSILHNWCVSFSSQPRKENYFKITRE